MPCDCQPLLSLTTYYKTKMRSFLYVLLSISISVQALPAASSPAAQLAHERVADPNSGVEQRSVPLHFGSFMNGRRRLEAVGSYPSGKHYLGRRQIRNADYNSSPNTVPSPSDSQNSQAPSPSDTPSEQHDLNSRNLPSARLQRSTQHLAGLEVVG